MPRDIYASKAHSAARIDQVTVTGKSNRDGLRQIDRLRIATRDDLSPSSSPADWARSNARFAKRVANGEVQTLASHGLPQSTLDKFERLRGDEFKQLFERDLNLF